MDTTIKDKPIIGYTGSAPVAGVGGAQVQGLGVTQNGTTPITASSLAPAMPFKLPPAPISTIASGLTGIANGVKDSTIQQNELDRKAQEAEAALNKDSDGLKSLYTDILNTESSRAGLEEEAGLGTKQQKVTDYTNRIEASERAQTNELRALEQAQGSGMSLQGKSEAAAAINRKYAFEQADLAVLQSAANRDFATAQSIVDRKIQLQLEPLKNQLEMRKFFYEENKEAFNKADQRKFEADLRAEERALDKETEDRQLLEGTRLKALTNASEQGAPSSVLSAIQAAKTPEDAIKAAGKYGGDLLDREIKKAQLAKLYSDIAETQGSSIKVDENNKVVVKREEARKISKELVSNDSYKAIRKGQDSLQFLSDFENLFNETGATSGVFSPRENADLKAKYNATILNLKEFFNLGVLNGPDEAILKGILPDPTNRSAALTVASGGIYSPYAGTKAGLETMKKNIETTIDDRFKSLSSQYGDYSPESIGSLKDLQRVYITQKATLNPDVAALVSENPDLTYEDIINIITSQ